MRMKSCYEDTTRVCLLFALEVIFMGKELGSVLDDTLMTLVEDVDAWNEFPWGEHICTQIYDEINNVKSKHKIEHIDGLNQSSKYVPRYPVWGFLWAFKSLVVIEADVIPRALAWSKKGEFTKSDQCHILKQGILKLNGCIAKLEALIQGKVLTIYDKYKLDLLGFHDLGDEFCDLLNDRFLNLFDAPHSSDNDAMIKMWDCLKVSLPEVMEEA
ncbi:hypothetical protein Tco_0525756 [Tanacetum coccineum]